MVAVPILQGVYVDTDGDFNFSYPVNREPIITELGFSKGYLRPAPGVIQMGTGPGADRGGKVWNGTLYRVMGDKLVSVASDGAVTPIGSVTGSETVQMDFSFDRLAVNAGMKLYYLHNGSFYQVTDPDLGPVIDMLWIDGYFMTTDGEFLVVTELLDPDQVDPLKYGSSEESPDPITGLMKLHGEVYALNRTTIEVFQNIGGNGFPFQRNSGALIEKGCVGPRAKAYIAQTFAFVGGGQNESVGVYFAGAGAALKVSTTVVDDILSQFTEEELYDIVVEARIDSDEQRLLIHLPTQTLCYYVNASKTLGHPVWVFLASGIQFDEPYLPRNAVRAFGKWVVGDKNGRLGYYDYGVSTQFGDVAGYRFDTVLLYNDSAWAILGDVELIGTPGRNSNIFFSCTTDGQTWGLETQIYGGSTGRRDTRMVTRPRRRFSNWMGLRFRGSDEGTSSFARLEADIEALA
ncbi:packaged DNA stabilization protein [Rhizorhabdus histidinilytica]|uniref:packaged DNA stabilization protein n=1 Tax=Rhizorhabdus histidinilytica TaxID=439228 RepID=UPI00322074DA